MTPPRLVIAEDPDWTPAQTFTVDRAPEDAHCVTPAHDPPVLADVVSDWGPDRPRCRPCWESIAPVLERNGHILRYTNAALAVWERPGVG